MPKTLVEEVEKAKEIFFSGKVKKSKKPLAPGDCARELSASYSPHECLELLEEALKKNLIPNPNLVIEILEQIPYSEEGIKILREMAAILVISKLQSDPEILQEVLRAKMSKGFRERVRKEKEE